MNNTAMLFPLTGVEVEGLSLRFGMSREEVQALLGAPESERGARSFFRNGELALDFDGAGKLNFVEFLGGREGLLQPELYGHPVFQTDAQEVLELLEQHGGRPEDEDGGYTYVCPELSVGLYREVTPDDIQQLVRSMSRMDITNLPQVDLAGEQLRANRWETVGLGAPDYYN